MSVAGCPLPPKRLFACCCPFVFVVALVAHPHHVQDPHGCPQPLPRRVKMNGCVPPLLPQPSLASSALAPACSQLAPAVHKEANAHYTQPIFFLVIGQSSDISYIRLVMVQIDTGHEKRTITINNIKLYPYERV